MSCCKPIPDKLRASQVWGNTQAIPLTNPPGITASVVVANVQLPTEYARDWTISFPEINNTDQSLTLDQVFARITYGSIVDHVRVIDWPRHGLQIGVHGSKVKVEIQFKPPPSAGTFPAQLGAEIFDAPAPPRANFDTPTFTSVEQTLPLAAASNSGLYPIPAGAIEVRQLPRAPAAPASPAAHTQFIVLEDGAGVLYNLTSNVGGTAYATWMLNTGGQHLQGNFKSIGGYRQGVGTVDLLFRWQFRIAF